MVLEKEVQVRLGGERFKPAEPERNSGSMTDRTRLVKKQ